VVAGTLLRPNYNSAGIYHPALLAAGFVALWRFDTAQRRLAFTTTCVAAVALGLWGIWQVLVGGEARASAHFESANSLAGLMAVLSVPVTLSLIARPALGGRAACLAIFAAASWAAQSRGASLAVLVGLAVGTAGAWLGGARLSSRGVAYAVGAAAVGCLLFVGAATMSRAAPTAAAATAPAPAPVSVDRRESLDSRLELYRASFAAWRSSPILGTGYLSFPYVLEAARPQVPSYEGAGTFFVHNDYLQTLQELGVVGLAALLAMLAAPFVLFLRRRKRWSAHAALTLSMCLGGIAAMGAHAMVDFPFYVPATLLVLGGLLGTFARVSAEAEGPAPDPHPARFRGFLLRAIAVTAATCVLLPPAVSQACARLAEWSAEQQEVRRALYWFKVASNFQPSDWRYRWVLGRMWTDQALITERRDFAAIAEAEFRAGVDANPLDLHNLLGLIQLHRRAAHLVARPAPPHELAEWSRLALRLAPKHSAARRERVLVLVHLDRWQEARQEAQRWIQDDPQNPIAAGLLQRLNRPTWPRSES